MAAAASLSGQFGSFASRFSASASNTSGQGAAMRLQQRMCARVLTKAGPIASTLSFASRSSSGTANISRGSL